MAWDITVEFPLWGEDGEFPQDGFFYESGDQVNEKHLDALWNGTQTLQDETESALEEIDSDRDGVVDEADTTNLYKNNDIDSDGDGKVDIADDADTVGGEPPSNFADTNHGNEEHSEDYTTLTEVNNNADVPNADFADVAGNASPSGIIVMWSGSIPNIPSGWTLCDGTDGTPDLTDRFVTGAGGQYSVGDAGGQNEVTLTESQLPSHSHDSTGGNFITTSAVGTPTDEQGAAGDSGSSTTDTTGNDQAHENRPPYYALAFIMKE